MKQDQVQAQAKKRPLTPVFAIDLPTSVDDGFKEMTLDNFYTAFGQAVTSARKHGFGQVLGAPPTSAYDRPDLLDEWRQFAVKSLQDVIDALELPDERIEMTHTWLAHGAVAITLRWCPYNPDLTHQEFQAARAHLEKSKRADDDTRPLRTTLTDLPPTAEAPATAKPATTGWDVHND